MSRISAWPVATFAISLALIAGLVPTPAEANGHEYVIVTSESLATEFQRLAHWKIQKGITAEVVTTEFIHANYPGIDEAERIRAFISDAYVHEGTLWVLLGGDADILPARTVRDASRLVWKMSGVTSG